MDLWQELLTLWPDSVPDNRDQFNLELEKWTRQKLIQSMLAYVKDLEQPSDTRHLVLIQLRKLFELTAFPYSSDFNKVQPLFEIEIPTVKQTCLDLLSDPDEMVRANAIFVLEKLHAYDTVEQIHEALNDRNSFVRNAGLQVLHNWQFKQKKRFSTEEEFHSLLIHLKDRDGSNRSQAVQNLLQLFIKTGYVPALEQAITQLHHDRAGYVRAEIAEYIGYHVHEQALIPALIQTVRTDRKAREAALWALIRLHKSFDVPPEIFIDSLRDPSWHVVNAATQGIQILRLREAIPALILALQNNPGMNIEAYAGALASFESEAQEAAPLLLTLYQKYRRDSGDLGSDLIGAYAKVSGKSAIPVLLDIYKDTYASYSIQRTVTLALQHLGWEGEDYIFGQ
jgi:HEAT repeat protein